jgi:hypothetical protein
MATRNTTAAARETRDRRSAHYAAKYAVATSDRERTAVAYDRLMSAIKHVQPDAARDGWYRRMEAQLDALRAQIEGGGRP